MLGQVARALVRLCRGLGSQEGRSSSGSDATSSGAAEPYSWAAEPADPLAPLSVDAPSPIPHLRSIESRVSIQLIVTNTLDESIRLMWISYEGLEVRYKTLESGKTHRQQTFSTHPWTFVTLGQPRQRLCVGGQPAYFPAANLEEGERICAVKVERPPTYTWSPSTHHCFPPRFRAAVRTLLLEPAAIANFGSLPIALRDAIIAIAAPSVSYYANVEPPAEEAAADADAE